MSWPPALPRLVAWVLLLLAAAGQVRVWSSGRGFWLDELSVAINLRERTWPELPGGLDYYQVAPVGWLAAGKALHDWVGDDEVILRLPSLVAGLALLVLTLVIARRAIGEWASAAAVGLVGFAPALLYYSGELKQYAVEAAVALGLLLLGDELVRRQRPGEGSGEGWRRWLVLAAGAGLAALAVTLSFSALIVLAGVASGLAVAYMVGRRWSSLVTLVAVTAPAALLGGVLALYRRSQPLAPGQDTYFAAGMPEPGGGPAEFLAWPQRAWEAFVEYPLAWRGTWWTLALVAGGLLALALRRRWHWLAMFAGVLVMAVLAAVLRGYPLADRVALYFVAPLILLAVAGLDGTARGVRWLGGRISGSAAPAAATTTAAVVVAAAAMVAAGPPIGAGVGEALDPTDRDRGREALADLAGRVRPGDAVIANWFADQLVRWHGLEVAGLVRMVPDDHPLCQPSSVDALLAGASRAWYLHGAPPSSEPADHTVRVVGELAERGEIIDAWSLGGGAFSNEPGWVLVDLTTGPDPVPPVTFPDEQSFYTCLTATQVGDVRAWRGG